MKSPKLYRVRSYGLRLLIDHNYSIDGDMASDRRYTVLQQDNLLFRQVRLITGDNRKFQNYVIFVDGNGVSKYEDAVRHMVRDGIIVDGVRYVYGCRSASMVRNRIFSFVHEDIWPELNERLTLGREPQRTVLSKYEAYKSLVLSSCHCLDGWHPTMIVVPDLTLTVRGQNISYLVDKTTMLTNKDGVQFPWTQKDIETSIRDVEINAFDGVGLIDTTLAKQAEEIIGSHSPVTTFILRGAFVKGLLVAVDYQSFFAEHGVDYIQDIFGRWYDAHGSYMIVTKSMFKGYSYFTPNGMASEYDQYLDLVEKYQHVYGIAKYNYSFEEEPRSARLNYQVLQDLDLNFDDFCEIAKPSMEWAERVVDGDPLFTFAFLGLTADRCVPVNAYARAIMKNPEMLNERCVRKYVRDSVRKYIEDMKCGRLFADASFRFLVPDLILFMEHVAGLPLRGCLAPDEFYSKSRDGICEGQYCILRNPHIGPSEHVILTGKKSPEIERYFGHLSNIAMIGSYSLTAQRLNGADFDGDLVNVVKNEMMMKGVRKDLPIVIDLEDKTPALAEENTVENRIGLALRTYVSNIGSFSNTSTAYHNRIASSPEQKAEFLRRISIISLLTGREIDRAKCGTNVTLPHYIEKQAGPLPAFMASRSPYYAKLKLSRSWSNMNRLAMRIDSWKKKLTWKRAAHFYYNIMIDDSIEEPPELADAISALFDEYNDEIQAALADQRRIRAYEDDDVREAMSKFDAENFVLDWGSIYESYKERARAICPDNKMLANIAVRIVYEKHKSSKSKFHWVVAEQGILDNIKQVPTMILPQRSECGEYEYLGRKYTMAEVNMIDLPQTEEDDFSEFDDWEYMDFD